MPRLQTMNFVIICLILSVPCVYGGANKEIHHKRTRKINKRVKMMSKSLEKALSMVEAMRSQKDQCETATANITEQLRELSGKIDDISGVATGAAQIDLTDEKGGRTADSPSGKQHTDSKRVRVDVTAEFDNCLNNLDLNIMTEENAYIWCLRTSLWQFNHFNDTEEFEDDGDLEILQQSDLPARRKRGSRFVRRRLAPRDMTQPPSGFRVRQEYRTLSLQQRQRFHSALNELYEDGTIECFARIHRAAIRRGGAHRGAAFLPWHRAFLAFFEEALRQVDPEVSIPYWDSSIDDNMDAGPGLSVMWDDEHLGQGNGIVNTGPFAGWVTVESPLRREIARGVGSLIRQIRIDTVMVFCRLGDFDSRWENAHNGVHRWVGGTMARSLSPSDPTFYLHHAFIDYQWEKFREHQLSDCGIDPAFDYPPTDDTHHNSETQMDGMTFLINRDGIANYWTTNWYNYEETPTCATNCGNTPDIFCDFDKNLCTGEIRFDLSNGGRKKRQATPEPNAGIDNNTTSDSNCKKNAYAKGCPGLPPAKTENEYVERIVRREIEMPPEIEKVDRILQEEMEEFEKYPPDSEPIFFQAAPDEPSDCRTAETCVFDLVTAILKGKKVTNRGYSGF